MRTVVTTFLGLIVGASLIAGQQAPAPVGYDDTPMQPNGRWKIHYGTRPQPKVVTPGPLVSAPAPQDATVLVGPGADRSAWQMMDGGGAVTWAMSNGVLETGKGIIRTKAEFTDYQLHVEFATPTTVKGDSQGRGNSGVFLNGKFEIQVLDSYQNRTYADGSASAMYGQYPPLVNASLAPGQWQTYDIVWTAPRFDDEGKLKSKARVTVIHNGVLVQNNVELTGPTGWSGRNPYPTHPERTPIAFQDHGNPVRYRNVWVRELGDPRHKEFMLSEALLESYAGDYVRTPGTPGHALIRRLPDGLLQLELDGSKMVLHAESATKFYALTTDVQCEFDFSGDQKKIAITVGDDFSKAMRFERGTK